MSDSYLLNRIKRRSAYAVYLDGGRVGYRYRKLRDAREELRLLAGRNPAALYQVRKTSIVCAV